MCVCVWMLCVRAQDEVDADINSLLRVEYERRKEEEMVAEKARMEKMEEEKILALQEKARQLAQKTQEEKALEVAALASAEQAFLKKAATKAKESEEGFCFSSSLKKGEEEENSIRRNPRSDLIIAPLMGGERIEQHEYIDGEHSTDQNKKILLQILKSRFGKAGAVLFGEELPVRGVEERDILRVRTQEPATPRALTRQANEVGSGDVGTDVSRERTLEWEGNQMRKRIEAEHVEQQRFEAEKSRRAKASLNARVDDTSRRALKEDLEIKHCIKLFWRLFGNQVPFLQNSSFSFYEKQALLCNWCVLDSIFGY